MINFGFTGPHGLREIVNHWPMDYQPQGKMVVKVIKRPWMTAWVMSVQDAPSFVLVDAYWIPKEGVQEEAEKWLLDWAVIVYGGEV